MKFRALRYTLPLIALFSITLLLRASLPTVATGTWVAAGNLSAARSGACTAVLGDGRLLISGGADANGPTGTADLFSTSGSWEAAASMTAQRSHQSCAALPNGHVLVAGGTTSSGGITNSAEIYDPSADSWTQAGVMNDARSGATASVLQDGRVLIAGGQSSGGALNTLEIFDPNSGNFSHAGTMSSPRQDHAAAVLSDGRVLLVGGSSDGANALATTDIYDPQAGSVSAGPAMSMPRARHTATTLLDGTVVVIGGSDYTNDLASAEFFDPAANNFNAASSLVTARSKHSAFLLPNNNEVLVVGGQSAGADLASAELYIPWQKAFQATGAMATPRSDATGAALTNVNGRLLMAGGSTASAELYGFATVKTDAADYPPGTTVNITGTGWQPGETVALTLVESPLIDTHGPYPVVADAFGNISDSSFATDAHDVNVKFNLTAVGSQSQAQNTFTDAGNNSGSGTMTVSPNSATAGSTGNSFTFTFATETGKDLTTPSLVTVQIPAGWTTPQNTTSGNPGFVSAANLTCAGAPTIASVTGGLITININCAKNGQSFTLSYAGGGTKVTAPTTTGMSTFTTQTKDGSNAAASIATQPVVTVNPAAANKLVFGQQPTSTAAGQAISPAVTVQIQDQFGNLTTSTASVTVAIGNNPSSGTLSGTATVAAVNGTATFSNLSIDKAGTGYTLTASSAGLTGATSSAFNITVGTATKLVFGTQPSNATAVSSITPAVTVQVQDAGGNVVTGSTASITIAIGTNPSSGTLSGTTTVNAVSGVATFSNLSIDKAGTGYTLTASSSGLTGATSSAFNITAGAVTKLVFGTQPSNTAAGSSITPAVTMQVQDAGGNLVTTSTASITVAIGTNPGSGTLSGTTTITASGGVATFSNLSINKTGNGYTLSATSTGLTSATSSAFNITAGAATQLVFSQQPTNTVAGSSISPAVTLQVEDANGNVVTSSTASITVAIGTNPGGGTLSGTKTVSAVSGVATFSGLSIDKTGTGYTLTAASTGLTSATSNTFNITPGAASKLVFGQQPTNTTAAQTITPAVTVQVQDANSNLVTTSTASITVAIGTNPGGGTLSGTLAQSAVGGVATFGSLSLNKAGTGYTLTASSTGLTGATSSTFNITAGAAAQLGFSQQPTNTVAGVSITPAITVQVQDANGNLVTTSTASIVVAIGTNPGGGTLSGTKTVSATAGVATFSNLSIDKVGTGYTLSASSTGLTSATSGAFTITPASATKFVVTGSGTQTAGTGNTLTITAVDNFGNTDTNFGPNISLMFSGANPSPDPATSPTATGKNGPVVFGSGTPVTFTNGVTTLAMTLYKAETASIVVSDGPSITTPGTLTVVVSAAAANKLALAGSTANLASGSARSVTTTVEDAFGNPIASDTRSVTFTQTAGTGSVSGLGSSNAVAGVATQTVTGNLAGTVTITASAGLGSGTGNPITFSVVAGAAAKLALNGATTDLASGNTRTLTATIQDAAGNTVNTGTDSTISITFARTSGTGTVTGLGSSNAVAGVATVTVTGALAGPITIAASGTASTGALAASTGNPITFNVVAGPAAKLALNGSTADLASGTTRQLTATIQDAGGNTVSTGADSTMAISFTKTAGTGTVTGLGSSSAVAGVATVTVTGNLAGPVTITASGAASTGALAMGAGNPIAFNVVAGAAAKLAFVQQPANTTAGQTISAVTVQILDANGNLTGSTASVGMALTGSPAGVTLSGTLTKAAVSGVATFNDLSINKGGTYTLSATSSGLTGATSAAFTINNPAPTLTNILPASGNLAQTLNVVFTGTNFISGVSSVNFGSDITVNTTSVDSATQITANITIAATAATGARNVSVTNSAPGGGTSATQAFTVVNPATTTQVVSSLNPSTFGLSVTFTATVSSAAGTPTGSVIFYDGACGVSALTGSLNLASGQATFTTASLNGGTHNISACYTPSGIFQSSFGSVSQVVTQATPTVTFTGAPATAYFSSQFTVSTSTNASTTPTITASGVCTISGTTVTITSGVGTCSLLASWAADTNYVAATATQSTSALQVPVSVTVSNTTATYDGTPKAVTPTVVPAVVYSVSYTGISPTVYATSSTAPTEPGSYLVVATVTDPNYAGSGSGTLTISQKDPALVLTLLTGMPEPSSYGTLVYFELTTASSPCPTGQAQFFVDSDSTPSATVALTSTTCAKPVEFSTATLTPGTHSVYAVYGGDTYYVNETSASVSHQVIADGTTVTLATSATEVFVGDSVTLTATVTPSKSIDGTATTPSGTVQFYDGTTLLGENPLSSNTAMFTISSLPAGSHSITATFVSTNGDFSGNSSPVNVETVDKITPTITWPNPADIVYGTKLSATQLNATATDTHNGGIKVNGTFTYNPAVDSLLAVGSRNLMVTFAPDDTATYGTQTASATINVTPATLTVTAGDASRYYGADNPTFTFQYSGFVNSEDKAVVTTMPTCNSTADSKSNIGTYAITCSGGVATNYTIKYVDGKLTVNPATLTASIVGDPTKPYDGNTTATLTSGNFSLSGVAAGDSIMITKTTGTYNSADVASANTVTVALASTDFTAGTGTLLTNYTLPTSASGAGQITKANANIVVTPYSLTYDGNPHTAAGSVTGVKSESLAGLDLSGTTHTDAGTYSDTWTFTDVSGNYKNSTGSVKDCINKADATIKVNGYTGVYDGNPHAATGSATGVKGEDLSSLLNLGASFTSVPGGTANWAFAGNTNYKVASGTATITIAKATPIVCVLASNTQYSDPAAVKAYVGLGSCPNITIGATGTVTFGVTGAAGTVSAGTATGTFTAVSAPVLQAGPGTYNTGVSAVFASSDPNFNSSSGPGVLTVAYEDARVTYAGNMFFGIPLSASWGTITLVATIQDITAVGPYSAGPPQTGDVAYDPYPGDISNATVTFVNRDVSPNTTLCGPVKVALLNASDTKAGSATCNYTGTVPTGGSIQYTVGIVVGGYYTRNMQTDNTVVTLSQVGAGMITGGGYTVMQNSAGTIAGDRGTKNNFGFNVKYNKGGTNLQGNINTIVRRKEIDGIQHVYQIKGNSMTSLATSQGTYNGTTWSWISGCPNGATATAPCKAQFNGKANIQDVTNPLAPVTVTGNNSLQFTMTDYGSPGTSDTIGITLWNGSGGISFSTNWVGNPPATAEQGLGGGDLVVH